jgi:hypothetical protein
MELTMENNNQLSEIERDELEYLRTFSQWVGYRHSQVMLEWLEVSPTVIELRNQMLDEGGTNFHKWQKMNDQMRLQGA